MSLTSTAFMAGPGGYGTTLSTKLDKIDCSQVLRAVLLADKALLGHIRMAPPGTTLERNWIEDSLNPAYVTGASAASTAMHCSLYTTASLARFLRNGALLQPNGTSLILQVGAAITYNTLTTSSYGSTTYAAFTITKCWIIGMPYADIDDASNDMSQTRPKRKNFMQVFERAVQITQTRKNMAMEAVVNELQQQIKFRTMEVKRELDMSVIMGYAKVSGSDTVTGDSELRTMAGIIQLIRDYDLDTTNEDDTVINASSSVLTVGYINSLAYKIFNTGGLDETADPVIAVGAKQARAIAAMEKDIRRVEQGERQVGYYRNVFLSDMGVEMPIVLDRWIPQDKLFILDRSRMGLVPMTGDDWHMEKMAKTGRNEKWQLSGQFTLELPNSDKCHGLIRGLG